MEDIMNTIANLGFPIALSVYLLIRLEGRMEKLTRSITELTQAITRAECSPCVNKGEKHEYPYP